MTALLTEKEPECHESQCPAFTTKVSSGWCDADHEHWGKPFCCSRDLEKDFCEPDIGAIVGTVVGVIFTISLCCVACCYCCKCCCFKYRQNQNPPVVMYVQQPGVQMQQMSYPPQQGYTPGEIVVAAPAQPTTQIQFADGTTLTPEQGQAKV